jgi:hypothetical protein
MKTRLSLGLAVSLLLALGLLSGCGQKSNSLTSPGAAGNSSAANRAEVSGVLALTPEVIEDGEFESPDAFSSQASGGAVSAFAAVRPFHWWRTINHTERSFEFAFSDTDSTGQPRKAIVTIHKLLTGNFNLVAGTMADSTAPESLQLIHKPLEDHWVRRVLLKHVPLIAMNRDDSGGDDQGDDDHDDGDDDRDSTMHHRMRWRVAATSGVQVTSRTRSRRSRCASRRRARTRRSVIRSRSGTCAGSSR